MSIKRMTSPIALGFCALSVLFSAYCVGHTERPLAPPSPETSELPPSPGATVPDDAGAEADAAWPHGDRMPTAKRDGNTDAASFPHGLRPEDIRLVVLSHRGALMACYETKAREDSTPRRADHPMDRRRERHCDRCAGRGLHDPKINGWRAASLARCARGDFLRATAPRK